MSQEMLDREQRVAPGLGDGDLMALTTELHRCGIRLSLDGEQLGVHAPAGTLSPELRERLTRHKSALLAVLRRDAEVTVDELPDLEIQPERLSEPFPLTDVQHAYWVGRDSALDMGSVATHLYVELDCERLDLERLHDALRRMIERHPMLRAVVDNDGRQRILGTVPPYQIAVADCRAAQAAEIERVIDQVRSDLSHQVLVPDRWPLFEIRTTLLPAQRVRLHVSLDLLILDAWSIFLFFREWYRLYVEPQCALPPLGLSFRDYVLALKRQEDSPGYRQAYDYWMARVDTLPEAPQLPLREDPAVRRSPRFQRREMRIPKDRWERLKATARSHGLTPSGVLLAAYSEVLARWSAAPHFTLNLTVSNRLQVHPDVNALLGDFTSVVLQEVDRRDATRSFREFAAQLQQQFARDLQYRQVSGGVIMREWAKRRGTSLQAAMPVVFSSGLIWTGDEEVGDLEQFGRKVHSISQTSQVWLDHHVMELQGDLHFVWDAAEAVFEPGVLDAMFDAYCDFIVRLADGDAAWDAADPLTPPKSVRERMITAEIQKPEQAGGLLHRGFVRHAMTHPDATAVLSSARRMTYGELLAESCAVAEWLRESGCTAEVPVAVVMHKGWEQAVAVLGTLLAGCAYLPVDADLPPKRLQELLEIGQVTHILTQPGIFRGQIDLLGRALRNILPGTRAELSSDLAESLQQAGDRLAYVIFTSGTTGVPKGVMIDHGAAMTTVTHINEHFGVGPDDRVLAVSSLSFDLSVYDLFGVLGAGGALVMPDANRVTDAAHWQDLLHEQGVTLWNSAPQLMRMLLDSYGSADDRTAPLRLVLLSGDFIAPELPAAIHQRYPGARMISLGGATEAAIWSIAHAIAPDHSPDERIPYGKALPNQSVSVRDSALRICPDHVQGQIYIGGNGLARGYWRDAERSAERFIVHPQTGERLYHTGDLGRYAADGSISILGRDDGQVKIRGHRVELGEIESILVRHPEVHEAVVLALRDGRQIQQLAACVVPESGRKSAPAANEVAEEAAPYTAQPMDQKLQQHVAEHLPDYMIPRRWLLLDRIPLTANGKVDHRALRRLAEEAADASAGAMVKPRDAAEQSILDAWSRVIVDCDIGVADNFFELGGDSVMATQLIREINERLPGFELEMHELFENLTVESLAHLYQTRQGEPGTMRADAHSLSLDRDAMLADLDAALARIASLPMASESVAAAAPREILLTGSTGWVGGHVLAELLHQTTARIHCLVRRRAGTESKTRLLETLRDWGIDVDPVWRERVVIIEGDLAQSRFGLDQTRWQALAMSMDAIFHLGATVNVLAAYATHSDTNVAPLVSVIQLAGEHRRKPLFFTSPMTVCRRYRSGHLEIRHDECADADPEGLLTGYAQSKWVAEQMLMAATRRGLPVKIYRTSHALPSASTGLGKPNDTYGSVLQVAREAGVVPDWQESGMHGVPVDILARLLVENALLRDDHHGVVHLENRNPLSFPSLLSELLNGDVAAASPVPLSEWKVRCLEAAGRLSGEGASLARLLFAERENGASIEHMFAAHPVDTGYFERSGQAHKLTDLTPPEYWLHVGRATRLRPAPDTL